MNVHNIVNFYRYEIYVLLNIIALFLTLYYAESKSSKFAFCFITAYFFLNLPVVADAIYYNEGFLGNGYSGSKFEYLWRMPQVILSDIGIKEYTLNFFRVFVLLLLIILLRFEVGTYLGIVSNAAILVSQNGLRQGISTLIVCYIFNQTKLYRMILISLVAGFFHSSGFVFGLIATLYSFLIKRDGNRFFGFDGRLLCYALTFIMLILAVIAPTVIEYIGYGNYFRTDGDMAGRVTGVYKYVLYAIDVILLLFISIKYNKSSMVISMSSLGLIGVSIVFGIWWGAHDLASRILLTTTIWVTVGYIFILPNIFTARGRGILASFIAARSILSFNVIKLLSL